ncbi:immunoglobulin lambda-1 light chain-like [Leucoraja erinacea]|uniref:immunoglobulin lambda-1 light chain-like n=1 Tax=Leucoraja erinaceus TaxID=7782 RepID=UPI0024578638|nr:immunoglobulin lambda-1 light chain-like [Leucoraja erinacea]
MSCWMSLVCALAFSAAFTNAQVALNQPSSKSTSLGQNVQISCIMTGGSLSTNIVSWYQQIPGAVPRFLFYYSAGSSITRGSGVSDRFAGSVSGNTITLTIANVQSGDAADYYCGVWLNPFIFGKGTRLGIGAPRAPAMSVLGPSAEEIKGKGTATLLCLVSGFNPGAVDIEWTVEGSARSDGVETSPIQQEKDNTFSASSYLTLPVTVWNSNNLYSCVVKHETQAIPFKADITRTGCI